MYNRTLCRYGYTLSHNNKIDLKSQGGVFMEILSVVLFVLFFVTMLVYVVFREYLYCKKLVAETKFFNAASEDLKRYE